MAISIKRAVTGVLGGVPGLANIGVGADKAHVAGNPTWTNSGLWFDYADNGASQGTAWFSKTGANTGTMLPWGLGGIAAYAKPAFASGEVFLAAAAGQNGPFFGLLGTAERAAITTVATDGASAAELEYEAGLLGSYGLMFYTDESAFSSVANPTVTPENSTARSISRYTTYANGTTKNEYRVQSVNSGGFRPGLVLTQGNYDGVEQILPTTFASIAAHIGVNEWYEIGTWARRSTAYNLANGEARLFMNGRCVARQTGALIWPGSNAPSSVAAPSLLEHFMSGLYGWTPIVGITPCFCAPYQVRAVPDADISEALPERWEQNATRDLAIQRLWPCMFPNVGNELTITSPNGGAIPTSGRLVNVGGVYPARSEAILRGTAGTTWVTRSRPVWDASKPGQNPFNASGWVTVSFTMDTPNAGVSTFELRNAADNASLCTVVIDDTGTGSVTINGQPWLAGRVQVPADMRWGVIMQVSAGQAVVGLVNLSGLNFDATSFRTRAVACSYAAGQGLGPMQLTKTSGVGARPMAHGALGVWRHLCMIFGDSYNGANASENHAISALNQGTKTLTVANMGARAPQAGDRFYIEGSAGGANDGTYTVASATATTITTVEALPSSSATGSVNLVYPRLHSINRIGQFFPSGADCESIPGGYDPCPFGMDTLRGFACCVFLARSGNRATDLLSTVLPQCSDVVAPWVVMPCFVVNDTNATTTEAAMETQARSIAQTHTSIAQWVEARGGKVVLTEAPNLVDAGSVVNGVANRFRRRTPEQVGPIVESQLAEVQTRPGSMFFARCVRRIDRNGLALTDGIHVDSPGDRQIAYETHAALQAQKGAPGSNLDGSVRKRSRGGGRGPVLSALA